MIASPDRLQAIILSKDATDVTHKLRIYDNEIKATKSVKLLGVEIDYQTNFNKDVSMLCSKPVMQLNTLYRLPRFLSKTEENAAINNFIYFSFNYCPLVWHICS